MSDSTDSLQRRSVLASLCALGLGLPRGGRAQGSDGSPTTAPPRENDWLVFAYGERERQIIAPDDLTLGAAQVFAWPMDPDTETARDGSRLNQILLVRLDPSWLSEETLARSVDGIVAYSGVCSHTGCDVTDWNDEAHRFQCPCHESQFDPSDSARVVGGPAPWQLAALPLKVLDGRLVVAGSFEGRVGFQQPGLNPFGL